MGSLGRIIERSRLSREVRARRKQAKQRLRQQTRVQRSQFVIEPLEQRLLLSGEVLPAAFTADLTNAPGPAPLVLTIDKEAGDARQPFDFAATDKSDLTIAPLLADPLLPLVVTSFAQTSTGFTVRFNRAIDPSVISLYDVEAGTVGAADATLVGSTVGDIKGSLVANGDTLAFVARSGVLAPDTYTVTVRSAANAIKDPSGNLLDGNNDGTAGDNYTTSFTVTPSSVSGPIISISDFARGPAQNVDTPGNPPGIALFLNDLTGVTSLDFTLNYNPEILKITQVHFAVGQLTGTRLDYDISQPGLVTVNITAPAGLVAPISHELLRFVARVPHNAPYGKTAILNLANVVINNGAINGFEDDGVQVVAYFGETTGNQRYSALDGQRALRVAAGLDSGFAAYPAIDPTIIADVTNNGVISALDGTRILQEVAGLDRSEIPPITPVILASLTQDTGISASDGLTNDPAFSGTVTDDGGISVFRASVDSRPPVNVTADLVNGSFSFTRSRLEQILGGPLLDGTHTIELQAEDNQGFSSTLSNHSFVLDSTNPAITSLALSAGSDTGTVGDNVTSAGIVSLVGSAEAGAMLKLGTMDILVGAGGAFQIPDVALINGANTITITSDDNAGNSAQRTLTITRSGVVTQDVALQWNQLALDAIRMTVADPPIASRILALVSLAQYDTLAAIEGTTPYLIKQSVTGPVSLDVALAKAAHTVLYALFPSLRASFDTALNTLLAATPNGAAKDTAIALGLSIGSGILSIRANDGSNAFVDYPGSTAVGQWRPTSPMFELADEPQWGEVTPFALSSPDEFRPVAPPALDSAAYAASVNEVKSLGSATSTSRTNDQTEQAQFWADGKGSYTPAGHWNLIAQSVALNRANSLSANIRLLAELNVALADSGIAAWDAKYTYGLWRPIDAIHNADQDNNAATIKDANWTPLLITPSHPEYVSGHSTYSAAAAAILAHAFGDNTSFTATAFTLPNVTRSFSSFTQAAQEAGKSRIYGGIHYEFTNQAGQQLGQQVAQAVLAKFALNQDTQAPTIIANETAAAANTNITLTGQILDNISGVAQAQYQIDDGALQNLTLTAQGNFSITTNFALNGTNDGLHTITITAKDAAGNTSSLFTRQITLDTRPPVIDLTSIAANSNIDSTTRLTGSADPTGSGLSVLNYKFDNGITRSIIFDQTTGQFDEAIELRDLTTGPHTLTITARDAAGNQATLTRTITLPTLAPLTITEVTPAPGSSDVGSTFRPQVFFSRAVDTSTLNSNTFYATDTTGTKLAANIVIGDQGHFAWLFFTNPMPGASTITVHVDGNVIRAANGGQLLDADGDGTAGGVGTYGFSTVALASIPNTTITGRVLDPGPDLEPMTFDDIGRGPDGVLHTPDDEYKLPIAHVQVYVLGRPDLTTFTDANGFFQLTNTPAGNIKLVLNGRTATNAPNGIYFPEMTLDLTIEPGLDNTVMGSMGSHDEQLANEDRPEVYLPRVQQSILQTVNNNETKEITVDATSAPNLTDEQRSQLKLMVQPGTLVDENGNPLTNAQIGISTVPPELVRDMLPPGVLQHTFDITIQAPGVGAFATPLQITFPNVFNAAPGEKLNFLSFDHMTGRLVVEGTATVSADGLSVTTDSGQGITKPGWHGLTALGNQYQYYDGQPCTDSSDRIKNLLNAFPKAVGAVFSVAADGLAAAATLVSSVALSTISTAASVTQLIFSPSATNAASAGNSLINLGNQLRKSGSTGQSAINGITNAASLAFAVNDAANQIKDTKDLIKDARDIPPCENLVGEDPRVIADRAAAAADSTLAKASLQAPLFAQLEIEAAIIAQIATQVNPSSPNLGLSQAQLSQLLNSLTTYVAVGNQIIQQGPFYVDLFRFFDAVSAFITRYASCFTGFNAGGGGGGGGGGGSGGGVLAFTLN